MVCRTITPEEIETYRRDGVVCLRGLLPPEWVSVLRKALDRIEDDHRARKQAGRERDGAFEAVTDRAHLMTLAPLAEVAEQAGASILREREAREGDGEYLLVNNASRDDREIRRMAVEGPLAEAAAALFGAGKINFLFDQVFVKQPGAVARTAFHQDQGYFRVDGEQCASFWTACEPVDRENGAMGYIKGSHRWELHAPNVFVSQMTGGGHGLPQLPDIEGNEDEYDIVYYDVEPGDVLVHDYRTVHGSRGNVSATRGRRSVALRYGGDDLVYLDRPSAPEEFPTDVGLADGDPLDGEVFPVVWRRA
ncbi:MAG: phytanoyl-CoA dioxygenase family protein [Myxococcota bacterium]